MYGDSSAVPFSESTSVNPQSIYGVSKLAVEQYLRVLTHGTETAVSVVRPGNIYGPGQNHLGEAGVIAIFGSRMLSGESVTIFGDGNDTRDYIYIEDAASAYAMLGERICVDPEIRGEAFNFSYEDPLSALDVVTTILSEMDSTELKPKILNATQNEIPHQYLDASKARDRLGWQPAYNFNEGLLRTIPWYVELLSLEPYR